MVKKKIFQLALPEEINITDSTAKRSQTTGYLLITMRKLQTINYDNMSIEKIKLDHKVNMDDNKISSHSKYYTIYFRKISFILNEPNTFSILGENFWK